MEIDKIMEAIRVGYKSIQIPFGNHCFIGSEEEIFEVVREVLEKYLKETYYKNPIIGKEIWFDEGDGSEPMHGKIVAIDIHDRFITEYDDLENEVFCDVGLEKMLFEEPAKIIEIDGKRYKQFFNLLPNNHA